MRSPVAALAVLAGLAAVAARPAPAAAHQSSFTYATLAMDADGRRVDYDLKIRTTDLFEALGGTSGDDPSDDDLAAGADRLYAYVEARVTLEVPGQACARARRPLAVLGDGDRFARVGLSLTCPATVEHVELDYDLFFDLDAGHIGLVRVDGETVQLRAPDDTRLVWEVGDRPGGVGGFVASGVHHIATGLDHILFLVALLLVAPLARPATGLALRGGRGALRTTAVIVTAFTAAHSLTLIAAALGWFALPGRLVESAIAASILYVAIEDAVRPDPPRRALVTLAFGLVHGLGFAAMLAPALPPRGVVLPLLAFNLGVELGQLAIVALALPLLLAAARALGAERYHRTVVRGGAVVLAALALVWLLERALEVTLLGL